MNKVVFIGTVLSSYHVLDEMLKNDIAVTAVFTLDRKYAGNVSDYKDLQPLCEEYNLPCYTFKNVNDKETLTRIKDYSPDYIFVVGLSQIVTQSLLEIPTKGCIGAHPSLLPEGRGRASLPWTILNEQKESGVSLFYLDEGVDSGNIIKQESFNVSRKETATSLYDKVAQALRDIIRDIAPSLKSGQLPSYSQEESAATYTTKRVPTDGYINWEIMSTREIDTLIRATTYPYPGAYTYYKEAKLIIWDSHEVESDKYCAVPGQILEITSDNNVWIKTHDGILEIGTVTYREEKTKSGNIIQAIGHKLGIPMAKVIEEMFK